VALGIALGVIVANSGGPQTTSIRQSALGAEASVPAADSFSGGPVAATRLGDLATAPVDGTGAAIDLNQTPAGAAASLNCTLRVPANPLTATGLATPWQLGDGCSMANAGTQGAFVEATILSPGGQVQVYNPLVVTEGTRPAATPKAPSVPAGSQVIIDVGFNGSNLALTGTGATQGNCVDASGQSLIGQVSACNAVPFYRLANSEIAAGTLTVPALGTASDGQPCQTTRDFALIDQDQSDNVVSQYLVDARGQTAQATAANKAAMPNAATLTNGSDDALLSDFVDPANGCTAYSAADPTSPDGTSGSQALNELSARQYQELPVAVTPTNDEMTLVGGRMSVTKTNVYRSLVDQPQLPATASPATVAADYCQNMVNTAPARDQADLANDAAYGTPVASVGDNLATFLGNRLSMSFTNLSCQDFGLKNPVSATLDGDGVATGVTYDTTQQKAATSVPVTTINPFRGQRTGTQPAGQRRTRWQGPSGA
jgi:hypothetical protein